MHISTTSSTTMSTIHRIYLVLFLLLVPLSSVVALNTIQSIPSTNKQSYLPTSMTWNFSPQSKITGAKPMKLNGNIRPPSKSDVPIYFFRTILTGKDFITYSKLAPGSYEISLGFYAPGDCSQGKNVFHVLINSQPAFESYDLSRACPIARIETTRTTVSAVGAIKNLLIIRLRSVVGTASIAFIRAKRIESEMDSCKSINDKGIKTLADHLAHAVPGVYRPVADRNGKGYATVTVDAGGSHTHFSTVNGSGYITSYEWSDANTGKILSTNEKFTRNFPLGVTNLKLRVIDSACSSDEAFTDITVTGNQRPGAYCYYYKDLTSLPKPGTLLNWPRPFYSAISPTVNFNFNRDSDRTFPFKGQKFIVRCIFFVDVGTPKNTETKLAMYTRASGIARLYRDDDLVVDTSTSATSGAITMKPGTSSYELIYRRTNLKATPFLNLRIDGAMPKTVSHDQANVLPILTNVDPKSASAVGGANVRLSGYGLYLPLTVRFGSTISVLARTGGATPTQVFVNVPKMSAGSVNLQVQSSKGLRSNGRPFKIDAGNGDTSNGGQAVCDDIAFHKTELRTTAGKSVPLNQPTSVATGPDGSLYLGTRGGRVQVVHYEAKRMVVKSMCHSEVLNDHEFKKSNGEMSPRTILGITFDPRDKIARPYVTTSTLFWGRHKQIDEKNTKRWANGNVERLKPGKNSKDQQQCLIREKFIVKGLPVADGDHSVNELVFTQRGDLLIAVGGYTNSGLPAGKLGGLWEAYFSASIVIARLSRKNFNGIIPYDNPTNQRIARPKSWYTHVGLFATGVRNLFSLQMSRSARIYGIDMGPNCEYGNVSSSCNQYNEAYAAGRKRIYKVKGQVIVDPKVTPTQCKYGPGRGDKLLQIKGGKYYGHANLQRGRKNECAWVDPLTNMLPGNKVAPSNYESPMAVIHSAKTGIREYGSNTFCGRLRGDLIMSQNSAKGTWRARLSSNGKLQGKPFMFLPDGGIRVVENVHGDLLFPKYFGTGVHVNRPKITTRTKSSTPLFVVNALPFRHGSSGGTKIIIGGWGFGKGTNVYIGGIACPIVRRNEEEIECIVPKRSSKKILADVKVAHAGYESVLPKAVLYMLV